MDFIKNVLAVLVGLIFFAVASFFGFFMLIGFLIATSETQVAVEDNSVLLLNLKGEIHEQIPDDPFTQIFDDDVLPLGLLSSVKAINEAKDDDRIQGLFISTGMFSGGFATLRELREAIIDFKSSGKFVYAYGEFMSEGGYYLASVADEIYLHPESSIEFNGLSANVSFFKGALDKLGIEPQIFRVGEFKSAIEPFIRKDLSAENRLQLEEWLTSLNDELIGDIATARNLDKNKVMEIANSMLVTNAKKAKEHDLISDLYYSDQVLEKINKSLGVEIDDPINFIATDDYYRNWKLTADLPRDRIAVVVAEGEIMGGKGNNYQVGSKKFASTIRKLRKNDRVKAMVIRINSPGGGMLASDAIWREISLATEQMPVIASMSDYATSGGYYLAMPCDTIVSHPTTLTGSIGVFGMWFNFGPLLNDKIGITHDVVRTGEYSDIFTVTRSLSEQEREIIQNEVEKSYATFIAKAAKGRNVSQQAIADVASGRIWSGTMAFDNGLVDVLGSFNDAIEIAANSADLDEYQVAYYPEQKSFLEEFIADFGGQIQSRIFGNQFELFTPYNEILKKIQSYQGIQARTPFEFDIN